MASIINHYIDLTKVDKSRLKDGKFLQITTVLDNESKYGNNVGTYESMSKEEKTLFLLHLLLLLLLIYHFKLLLRGGGICEDRAIIYDGSYTSLYLPCY